MERGRSQATEMPVLDGLRETLRFATGGPYAPPMSPGRAGMELLRSITTSFVALVTFTATAVLANASGAAAAAPATLSATSVSAPLDVTRDRFANDEESLGMSPDGSLLAGA